jgi:hypothetical protein
MFGAATRNPSGNRRRSASHLSDVAREFLRPRLCPLALGSHRKILYLGLAPRVRSAELNVDLPEGLTVVGNRRKQPVIKPSSLATGTKLAAPCFGPASGRAAPPRPSGHLRIGAHICRLVGPSSFLARRIASRVRPCQAPRRSPRTTTGMSPRVGPLASS